MKQKCGYCENDCLVVYYYILKELEDYINVYKIPLTSTGHVRRELQEITSKDWAYRKKVNKAINTDPHIYNMMLDAFQRRLYTSEIGYSQMR